MTGTAESGHFAGGVGESQDEQGMGVQGGARQPRGTPRPDRSAFQRWNDGQAHRLAVRPAVRTQGRESTEPARLGGRARRTGTPHHPMAEAGAPVAGRSCMPRSIILQLLSPITWIMSSHSACWTWVGRRGPPIASAVCVIVRSHCN